MKQPQKVWYASYGSNILESRFHCYIRGGKPAGATQTYAGCSDKTLPEDNRRVYINSEVYFAKKAKTWNGGGVAFIKNQFDKSVRSPGRMYLISTDQFVDVVRQEIGIEESLQIDLDKVRQEGSSIVKPQSWYGNIIFLGDEDGYPIYTFTSEVDLLDELNAPNEHYLRTISNGLRETYGYSDADLANYFEQLTGVKDTEMEGAIKALIK